MKNTNSPCSFWNAETFLSQDDMLLVIKPERGYFSIETVKRWAVETAFIEEGKILDRESISLDEAVVILHRYDFAKISGKILDNQP